MPYKNPHYHRDYFREHNAERRAYMRARYHADPSKQREAEKRYKAKHGDKIKARNNSPQYSANRKAWLAAHPEKAAYYSKVQRLKKYGLTPEQREAMAEAQGQLCPICRISFIGLKPQRINVDHCHTTGKVRALLCNKCNTGIGALKEDPAIFAAALAYLQAHGAVPQAPEPVAADPESAVPA